MMSGEVKEAAEELVAASRDAATSVDGLLSTLERDVYAAADRCWRMEDRVVTLRGGVAAAVTLRAKAVCVTEATFLPEEEQQGLACALDNWRSAVQAGAAAAALRQRVAEQQLVLVVGRVLQATATSEALLPLLSTLLEALDALASLQQRSARGAQALLLQLAVQAACAWRGSAAGAAADAAGGEAANNLLAAHASAPPEVVAALLSDGDAAAAEAAAVAAQDEGGDLDAALAVLRGRQEALAEELEAAADLLRFWGRRGEKAAAGSEGARGGREGDVPPMMAQAQQLLWGACQAYEEEQAAADVRTRQLVCQRYRPLDVPDLQARADQYSDGERLPAQQAVTFEQEFVALRGQARAAALRLLQDKAVGQAAEQLHQLRHLLLDAALPPEAAPARRQLLVRVAEALLDGSTPPAAVPLLAALLQEGLRRQAGSSGAGAEGAEGELGAALSEADKARLVPLIAGGMAPPRQPGARQLLQEGEGAGLLRALLRPEAALNAGQLGEAFDALQLVVDACVAASLPAEPTRAALAAFDAARLAVLLCEQQAAPGSPRAGPGVQSLLALARAALAQPGADAAGLGLLEGVLTLQPAAYAAAVLQIGLACEAGGARAAVLGMLCRVPTDLLPPPVLADALIQLAEALDGSQLAPPFLPYDLLGRLYRSAPVMQSLRLAVERGPDAAAAAAAEAAAARGSDEAWTVRIGGQGEAADAGADAAAAAAPEGAAGSSSTAQLAPPELPRGAAAEAARGLLLLPLQASSEPLAALLQRLVGALLSCLLRRAGSALDATSTGEELLQLLEALLMPAAEEGPWLLQWLWAFLFQEALLPFLADAGAALEGDGGDEGLSAAFLSYWASLPWGKATFHAAAPAALASLRLHLGCPLAHGPAAVLLRSLDFAPALAKAAPKQELRPAEPQMYSLGDEEEEEAAAAGLGDEGAASRGAWAAELGLLALHAAVLVPLQDQPDWLQALLHGAPVPRRAPTPASEAGSEADVPSLLQLRSPLSVALLPLAAAAGEGQSLLPPLLAGADWQRVAAALHAEEGAAGGAAPWLLLPLLLAPAAASLQGPDDVGGRLVHAAALLSRAAVLSGSPQALACAAGAASPLLLLSVCQGAKHAPEQPRQQSAAAAAEQAAAAAATAAEAQEQVVVPADFPMELLADTVEGQQLMLLQQQDAERQAAAAAATAAAGAGPPAAAAAEGGAAAAEQGQGPQLPLVEVQACWSLSCGHQVALLQQALLPLAASQASPDLAACLQPEHCPPELAAAAAAHQPGALREWHAPRLAELLEASAAAAATLPAAAPSDAAAATAEVAAAGLAAVLVPLVQPPATLLSQQPLPFANSELPLDTEAALYVSLAPDSSGGAGQRAPRRPLGALGAQLSALLPGSEARRRAAERAEAALGGAPDAHLVKAQLSLAVQTACKQPEGAALAACLLRLLYACPAAHAADAGLQLSEGLLRFLAAPSQDGGPLGQGAAAAAAAIQRPGSAASEAAELNASVRSTEALPLMAAASADPAAATASQPAGATPAPLAAAGQPSMQLAAGAAQGLPPATLLGLARAAAQGHAPLTAALALEQLREATTVLPKEEWQAVCTQVLQVAVLADSEPAHPFDLAAVWLAALPWVADSRWRRLGAGQHTSALLEWLESLDLRVVALRLAHADDFGAGSPGGSPTLLAAAADRLKSLRQHIPRMGHPHGGEGDLEAVDEGGDGMGALPGMHPAAAPPGGQQHQFGSKLRTFLSGKKPEPGSSAAAAAAAAAPEAGAELGEGKKGGGWGGRVRHRLAKIGLGGDDQQPPAEQAAPLPTFTASPGGGGSPRGQLYGVPEAGVVPGTAAAGSPGATGSTAGGSPGGAGGSGEASAVRKKLSSGLQAVGRGLSKVKTKLTPEHGGAAGGSSGGAAEALDPTDHDIDVAVRLGLAAFAVSAFVKSVLCPSLALPRGGGPDSAGPGTPSGGGGALARVRGPGHHRHSSSFGSSLGLRSLDAEYLAELDRVLEARSELDSLDALAACPLLQLHPARFQPFLQDAPQLLSAATSVQQLHARLQQLLFPGEPQLQPWA